MKGNTVWEHKHGSSNCTWNAFFYWMAGREPADRKRSGGGLSVREGGRPDKRLSIEMTEEIHWEPP